MRGPKISAPDKAIEGFCRSNNLRKEDLEIKDINGTDFYFYINKIKEKKAEDILIETLSVPISEYVWPKSMYWGDYKIKWVRPLRNILCIFDGKTVPFEYGHLKANNICYGHRFMAPEPTEIFSYEGYKKHLDSNFVVLKAEDRVNFIKAEIEKISMDKVIVIKDDPYLLEEVSLVISGNEKVLSARLADALYFYNQDLKTTLADKSERLDKVIFHAKLGSLKDKTLRLVKLCEFIDPDNKNASKAALLCKSDIVSEVVDEFPALQGIMGYYYAIAESQDNKVAEALRDHYKPQGPNDECPQGSGAILALADKMDSLCGLILAGERPSGSKDPYAIRRQALGIIRIILENKFEIDLGSMIIYSLRLYKNQIEITDNCKEVILQFLVDRIKYFFKSDYSSELVAATLDLSREPNILSFSLKIRVLSDFIGSKHGKDLLQSYKRANNLLGKHKPRGKIDESLFITSHEKDLFECIKENKKDIDIALGKKNYKKSFELLASFHTPLSNFFENVLIKDKDKSIAQNRMLILEEIRGVFDQIVNFDKL